MTVHVTCWCISCEDIVLAAKAMNGEIAPLFLRVMIVCPECGNKRCPRAAHHGLACTGSNEPGQPGSAYPARMTAAPTGPDPRTDAAVER